MQGSPVNIPAILLNDIHLDIQEDAEGNKCLVMGPVALVLPLSPEGVEWLAREIQGKKVQVVPASALGSLITP